MINNLPKKYHFSHDYALFLHDILAAIITQGESADVFTHTIELTDQKHADILDKMPDDDRWDWLEANGYSQQIHEIIYRYVIAALLSDFCHFVFEALSCSRKSKLTVAYSLLRKPFKDNLFYLEWLLAEPTVFINTFQHGGPEKLEDHRSKQHLRLPITNWSSSELTLFSSGQVARHEDFQRETPGRTAPTGAHFVRQSIKFVHYAPPGTSGRRPFGTFLIVVARCLVCGKPVCLDRVI